MQLLDKTALRRYAFQSIFCKLPFPVPKPVPSDINTLNKFVSTECLQPNCRTCDEHIDICDVCNIGYMVEISGACTGNSLRYNIILVLGKQVNGDTLNRS